MKKKRFISLAVILIQLFALSSCREVVTFDTHYSEAVYKDEEFFSAPEIIVRATAESIEKEYFTAPDGEDYENAHITVYNMKIGEIYAGAMEADTFQLKLFNGKGMSPELYLYGKDDRYILEEKVEPFLLKLGQEYILGLTFLDPQRYNCYNDPGGWAIQHGQMWTFVENENGLYENLDRGVNHKEFDIETLKNKIASVF
ncbi:MAG: hypothetical protein IKM48_07395 [Clostridia bacterium]|nr:hypothetical protein [Clostridia bacterium]